VSLSVSDIDWNRLSPRSRETLEKIAVPIAEDGKSMEQVAGELGIDRREVAKAMELLREEAEAQVHGGQLPPLSQDDYEALRESIRTHGQLVPILVDGNGEILDGVHRARACQDLGLEPRSVNVDTDDPHAVTLAVQLARRQLTTQQKRKIVEHELIRDPERSDRSVAAHLGVSHPFVAGVRRDLQARGRVETVSSRLSADGRVRPSTQPPRPVVEVREPLTDDEAAHIGAAIEAGEQIDAQLEDEGKIIVHRGSEDDDFILRAGELHDDPLDEGIGREHDDAPAHPFRVYVDSRELHQLESIARLAGIYVDHATTDGAIPEFVDLRDAVNAYRDLKGQS
jgi:ParB-like chromosome segregation protein Spo0J